MESWERQADKEKVKEEIEEDRCLRVAKGLKRSLSHCLEGYL